MKFWTALIMALLMTAVSGCSTVSAPEKTVSAFFDKLIKGDIKGAGKLTADGTLNLDKHASELYSPLFGSIRYSINGCVTEGDNAQVSVTVLAVDMATLMTEASAEVTRYMLTGGGKSGDTYFYTLLLEKLTAPEAASVTYNATALLYREGGKWKISLAGSYGLADAITGGMGEIIGFLPA